MRWKNLDNGYESRLESFKLLSPYEKLDIQPNASLAEAKQAYRRKVSLYHPDRTDAFMSSYSEEIVKLLNQAIELIKEEKNGQ